MAATASPDERHLHLLQGMPFHPVFIIGDHRSGTTLLHRLLAETGCFNYLSAYHVVHYDEILTHHVEGTTEIQKARLMQRFDDLGLKNRIIDDVPATPDSPVEYGFILTAAFKTRRAFLTERAHGKFLEICRKLQYISGSTKPLVLKNPWDALNFMDIKRRIPEARFIFIHRHPLAVMTSQVRAARSMLAGRNPFAAMLAPWYAQLYERPVQLAALRFLDATVGLWVKLVGIHVTRAARYFVANIDSLPKSEYTSVKYEDLCRWPDRSIEQILDFVGVTPSGKIQLGDRIQPRALSAPPDVHRQYCRLQKRLKPFLTLQGYEAEPADMC